jgi:ATP-dependent DNA ligase
MARPVARRPGTDAAALPQWIRPQLTELVDEALEGPGWLHEIKFDGYRMHARLDRGSARLLTRTGLDWTHKYPAIAAAVSSLGTHHAYLDGELCGVGPDGITSFSMIQLASDAGNAAGLVFFLFDLLYVGGEDLMTRPLIDRKTRLAALLSNATSPLQYCDHQIGRGREFHKQACAISLEGIVSKHADAPYTPGNRGLWRKVKCLHREEFVVIGWSGLAVALQTVTRLVEQVGDQGPLARASLDSRGGEEAGGGGRSIRWSLAASVVRLQGAAGLAATFRPDSSSCRTACSR